MDHLIIRLFLSIIDRTKFKYMWKWENKNRELLWRVNGITM